MTSRRTPTDVALAAAAVLVLAWAVIGAAGEWRLRVALLSLTFAVALAFARRWPIPPVGLALAGLFLMEGAGEDTESAFFFALVLSCFVAGRYAPWSQLPWVAAAALWLVSGTLWSAGNPSFSDAIFPILFTVGPCLLGLAIQLGLRRESGMRDQARLLDAMRDEEVRRASAEERLRIARELHDIVAHDISAVSLQAQVARRDAQAGRQVDPAALMRIEHTAQQAMHDARRLLGLLRRDDGSDVEPSPGLGDLDGLLHHVRAVGQRVALEVRGAARPLPPALSQTVYRIVQEALTNARRHGTDGTTDIRLLWSTTSLELQVTNPWATTPARPSPPGHGIVGITQRAEMFGGTARIGATGNTWEVLVRLPLPGEVRP